MGHYVDEDAPTEGDLADSAYTGPWFPLDDGMIAALQGVYGAGTGSVTPLSAVPEPATWVSMLLGISFVAWKRARRSS